MKKWQYFVGSCILAAGLLIKAGAPLIPVLLGMAVAAYMTWRFPTRPKQRAL